ncbi:riboflavin synthase domain-like protein [Parathielavia appendiculata]|uniref:Riboflavin synthase domain-like protein n=1 Tax=Parathielavia appendiculata TaxID=2587402 RepID=A0AAN6TZP7_9PEZI|nr:riboflavin synthase domain-like protein [Parathielavia appendiculata]
MVTEDFTRLTLDTLALCTMDFRFNSYYHDALHPFIAAMVNSLTELGARAVRPLLASIFYREANRKYWEDIGTLRQTAQGILDSRRRHLTGPRPHVEPVVYGENARDFVPDRMLDENIERLTKEYPDCWKPFGSGIGACIGRLFAWQASPARGDKHINIQLPDGITYKVGDYVAVLPFNPKETVTRVMRKFQPSWDSHITIGSNRWTALPTGTPISVYDVLGSYVKLSQSAIRRGILLADASKDEATKQQLHTLAGDLYASEISLKRASILDLLEGFPSVSLPFGTFLSLLPLMRLRQYSISSSPAINPTRATLAYSLLEGPALANPANRHIGVATAYLASLLRGDRLLLSVRPTHTAFRLPDEIESTPIICVAAGSGLAPFRDFSQERAVLRAKGRELAPALLFSGCCGPEVDDLYRDEFDEWHGMGVVDVRRAEEVKGLWECGARVYVCGSRLVKEGVKQVMGKIVLGGGATEDEVSQWYESVRNDRYATNMFD